MRKSDFFTSKYTKLANVEDGPICTEIEFVNDEMLPGFEGAPAQRKAVAYFKDQKPLILSRTAYEDLEVLAGSDDTEDFAGLKVVLFKGEIEINGNKRDALRIRAPGQTEPPTTPTRRPIKQNSGSGLDDEIPF